MTRAAAGPMERDLAGQTVETSPDMDFRLALLLTTVLSRSHWL
jgi:hypothetical protein